MRVDELGERALVKRLARIGYPPNATLPPGDDAGAVPWGGGHLLLKTDGFAYRQVALQGMSPEAVGWRAVTAVASDLVAKLARPLGFTLALAAPGEARVETLVGLTQGAARAAAAYGAALLGGDTNAGGELAIYASGVGVAEAVLPRAAAPGDGVYLLGDRWGLSGAAIHAHYHGIALEAYPAIRRAGHWPKARLEVLALGAVRDALAGSADSSDGLAETLWQLAEALDVGIHLEALPVPREVRAYAAAAGVNARDLVLYGGEEYEVVLVVKPGKAAVVERALRAAGVPHHYVGRVVREVGVWYRGEALARRGYEHFRE